MPKNLPVKGKEDIGSILEVSMHSRIKTHYIYNFDDYDNYMNIVSDKCSMDRFKITK